NARNVIHKIFELRTRVPELASKLPLPEMRQQFEADVGQVISRFEELMNELAPDHKAEIAQTANEADLDDLLIALAVHGLTRRLPSSLHERSALMALGISDNYWRAHILANLVCLLEGTTQRRALSAAVEALQQLPYSDHKRNLLVKFGA